MINLKEYYLCDLYEMSSGISTTPKQAGHGSPFVSFGCIYNNTILPEELQDMMDTSLEEQEKYSVKEGDIFITRTSETLDELAMSSVAIKDYPGATFSGFAKRLRPLQNNITYAKFMAYFLRSDYFRKIVNCKAVMTLRASFNEEIFSYIKVKLPEYEHQVKCGDFFWTIEEKIRCNKKIISELELLAKTIYDYWFLQYDFPDENGKPYKSSGGKMVWNEELKRGIPANWVDGCMNHIINYDKGGDWGKDKEDGNYTLRVNCIRGTDFPAICGNEMLKVPIRYILEKNRNKILEQGDIIIEISGGSPTQSTGRVCYINEFTLKRFGEELVTSNFCKAITLVDSIYMYWFYLTWQRLYDNDVFFLYESKTTGIKNLLFEMLCCDYKVAIPNKKIIEQFHCEVAPLFDEIQRKHIENQELSSLRDFLLPLLMNGQIGFRNVAISNKE